jgi:hypothetical protein
LARAPSVIVTSPERLANVSALWRSRGAVAAKAQIDGINPDWLIRATSRVLLGAQALCRDCDAARSAH